MALEDRIDLGAQPRSVTVNGDGTTSLVFPVPAATIFALESVYVEVDASGAGATTATLTLADQSGQVIARKRQSETIDAGASGSATWALRLADEAASAPAPAGGISFDTYPQAGQWLYLETDGPATSPSGFGLEILDQGPNGINVQTVGGGDMEMRVRGGGELRLRSTGGIRVKDEAAVPGTGVRIESQNGPVFVTANQRLALQAGTDTRVTLGIGQVFTVYDSAGNKLVEVRDDDTLHIASPWIVDL